MTYYQYMRGIAMLLLSTVFNFTARMRFRKLDVIVVLVHLLFWHHGSICVCDVVFIIWITTAVFVSDFQIFVSLGDYRFPTDISFQICKVQNECRTVIFGTLRL